MLLALHIFGILESQPRQLPQVLVVIGFRPVIQLIVLLSDTIHIIGPSSASIDLGSDIDLCIGEQTYLTPTVVGGTGPFNYNWNTLVSLVLRLLQVVVIILLPLRC